MVEKVILAFPDWPSFVVITITPFAALLPQRAAADAPFKTCTDAISAGFISFNRDPKLTASEENLVSGAIFRLTGVHKANRRPCRSSLNNKLNSLPVVLVIALAICVAYLICHPPPALVGGAAGSSGLDGALVGGLP